jgi:anti-anti-sigma factor
MGTVMEHSVQDHPLGADTWHVTSVDGLSALRWSDGSVDHIVVTGELDVCTAGWFVALVRDRLRATPPHRVVVELSGIGFIDARGVGALVQLRHDADDDHRVVTFTAASAAVHRVLGICGLDALVGPSA